MKINATFTKRPSFRTRDTLKIDIQKKFLLLSVIDIAVGIAFGTILFISNNDYISSELFKYFISFETDFSSKSFAEIFFGFLAVNLVYITLVVIFGTSAIGKIPVVLLTLIKSVGIGALASYLFSEYGLQGLEYFMLVFFPGKVILLFSMVLLIQNSLLSSHKIRQVVGGNLSEKADIKLYLMRTLIILLFFALSSLIDTCTIKLFSSLFDFS